MRYSTAVIVVSCVLCGCSAPNTTTASADSAAALPSMAGGAVNGAVSSPGSVLRTTTEGDLAVTVRYPLQAVVGGRIPVTVTVANRGQQSAWIRYSDPVRAFWPVVCPNRSGKMPFTKLGEQKLGSRDETSNDSYELAPGRNWSFNFDLTDYYQLPFPHQYALSISTVLEHISPESRNRTQFDVGGLLIDVKALN